MTRGQAAATSEEKIQTIRLIPLFQGELVMLLGQVGFKDINLFGSIFLAPFDAAESKDLVVLAQKKP